MLKLLPPLILAYMALILYGHHGHHFDVYLYVSSLKNFHIFNLLFSAF